MPSTDVRLILTFFVVKVHAPHGIKVNILISACPVRALCILSDDITFPLPNPSKEAT